MTRPGSRPAVLERDGVRRFKAVGKLDNLLARVGDYRSSGAVTAIGHTRWATHGKPTETNAHPHGLTHSQVVHNGIIENYVSLKASVSTPFLSQTDSEVIVHLFEKHLAARGTDEAAALQAFRDTLDELHGAYAILLITDTQPGRIFFLRARALRCRWATPRVAATSPHPTRRWWACARRRCIWKTGSGAWPMPKACACSMRRARR